MRNLFNFNKLVGLIVTVIVLTACGGGGGSGGDGGSDKPTPEPVKTVVPLAYQASSTVIGVGEIVTLSPLSTNPTTEKPNAMIAGGASVELYQGKNAEWLFALPLLESGTYTLQLSHGESRQEISLRVEKANIPDADVVIDGFLQPILDDIALGLSTAQDIESSEQWLAYEADMNLLREAVDAFTPEQKMELAHVLYSNGVSNSAPQSAQTIQKGLFVSSDESACTPALSKFLASNGKVVAMIAVTAAGGALTATSGGFGSPVLVGAAIGLAYHLITHGKNVDEVLEHCVEIVAIDLLKDLNGQGTQQVKTTQRFFKGTASATDEDDEKRLESFEFLLTDNIESAKLGYVFKPVADFYVSAKNQIKQGVDKLKALITDLRLNGFSSLSFKVDSIQNAIDNYSYEKTLAYKITSANIPAGITVATNVIGNKLEIIATVVQQGLLNSTNSDFELVVETADGSVSSHYRGAIIVNADPQVQDLSFNVDRKGSLQGYLLGQGGVTGFEVTGVSALKGQFSLLDAATGLFSYLPPDDESLEFETLSYVGTFTFADDVVVRSEPATVRLNIAQARQTVWGSYEFSPTYDPTRSWALIVKEGVPGDGVGKIRWAAWSETEANIGDNDTAFTFTYYFDGKTGACSWRSTELFDVDLIAGTMHWSRTVINTGTKCLADGTVNSEIDYLLVRVNYYDDPVNAAPQVKDLSFNLDREGLFQGYLLGQGDVTGFEVSGVSALKGQFSLLDAATGLFSYLPPDDENVEVETLTYVGTFTFANGVVVRSEPATVRLNIAQARQTVWGSYQFSPDYDPSLSYALIVEEGVPGDGLGKINWTGAGHPLAPIEINMGDNDTSFTFTYDYDTQDGTCSSSSTTTLDVNLTAGTMHASRTVTFTGSGCWSEGTFNNAWDYLLRE